jgi:hypothetical protein
MKDQRGMALALALFALVIVGALVAATFFVGRLEQQSGQNTLFAFQAAEAAEAAVSDAIASLTEPALQALPLGSTLTLPDIALGDRAIGRRVIIRLTGSLFLIRATGRRLDAAGSELAVRDLGSLVKLVPDSISGSNVVRRVRERSWMQLYGQ